jgi:transglutaminase-like putative cysteine protease
MYLQRLLQINLATLAGLATLLLSMGEDTPGKALLVWLAAGTSIWLTDVRGWLRLNRTMASAAALALGLWFAARWMRVGGQARILVVADLVVYLQVILFFQKKDRSTYWLLAIISLLEVVVAAWFSQGAMFGVLLVVYMLTGLSALALLFLYTQWSRYQRVAEPPQPKPPPGSRWPLADQSAVSTTAVGSSRAGIVRELFLRLAMLGLGTLVLTAVIFISVPRRGHSAWRGALLTPRTIVGFNDAVTLGQLGLILESREEVMRVHLTDYRSGQLLPVQPQLYLRGVILTHYDRGQWTHPAPRRPPPNFFLEPFDPRGDLSGDLPDDPPDEDQVEGPASAAPPRPPGQWVRQQIKVEPLDRDELFCIWPWSTIPSEGRDSPVFYDPARGRLLRKSSLRGERFVYQLVTTAFAGGRLQSLVPCNDPGVGPAGNDCPRDLGPLLQVPRVPHLVALARQWVAASGLRRDGRLGLARLLEQQLGRADRFQYSLEGQPRDPRIDPIEDFVTNHPRGHCEYFAAALALMLRSQGIPARVVLGYRCDEWNSLGKFYQVRQSDAHAWVEAYLAARDIPQDLRWGNDPGRWDGGAWLRLDATPPSAEIAGHSALDKARQGLNWIDSLWSDYVVEMDRQRQEEAVYQPLVAAIRAACRKLCSAAWWGDKLRGAGNLLNLSRWNGLGGWLLHVGLPLLLAAALAGWMARGLWRRGRQRWWRRRDRAAAGARRIRPRIEFYHRFEVVLARQGLVRAAGQTPRELARAAAQRIVADTGRQDLAAVPGRIVDAFYHVRFGGLPLDNPRREAVEHGLAELEHVALSRHPQ